MQPALIAETLMNNPMEKISEGMRVKHAKNIVGEMIFISFCRHVRFMLLKKNNIFATVNIAKVSSYGDFYELCSFFVGNMTV